MTTFTTIHSYTGEGHNGGNWYGYGKYTKDVVSNAKWCYKSEFDVLPDNPSWGNMGIWAASDPYYYIIGERFLLTNLCAKGRQILNIFWCV